MIKKHPKLKVILAHLGANMMWEQVRDVLAGVDGEVYFDTAFTSMCPDDLMQLSLKSMELTGYFLQATALGTVPTL